MPHRHVERGNNYQTISVVRLHEFLRPANIIAALGDESKGGEKNGCPEKGNGPEGPRRLTPSTSSNLDCSYHRAKVGECQATGKFSHEFGAALPADVTHGGRFCRFIAVPQEAHP